MTATELLHVHGTRFNKYGTLHHTTSFNKCVCAEPMTNKKLHVNFENKKRNNNVNCGAIGSAQNIRVHVRRRTVRAFK